MRLRTFKKGHPGLYSVIVGVIILAVGMIIAWQRYSVEEQERVREVSKVLEIIEQRIEETINESYSAALLLALTVGDNGEVRNFEKIASNLVKNHKSVDVLELVPDGVIEYVYPLEGNESVLGYDILNDPKTRQEVLLAEESNFIYFAGPLELKQGGLAVIGRIPVYVEDELWGFSAVILYMETLIKRSGINDYADRFHFQLSKINPNTGKEEFFLPEEDPIKYKISDTLDLPEGDWKLSGTYVGPNYALYNYYVLIGVSIFLSILISYFFYGILRQPEELRSKLEERTRELFESKEEFRKNSELLQSVLESPKRLSIFSFDKNYRYLAFNTYHEQSINDTMTTKSIRIGDSIFDSLNESSRSVLKECYDRAFNGESFEQELELLDRNGDLMYWQNWFSPIYKNDGEVMGITVISNEITSRIMMEKELEKKENRHKALITHSPICIHEINLEGELISINDAGLRMFGIEDINDFLGITYPQLLGEEQSVGVLKLFDEALEGKDSEFEFEVNERNFISSFVPIFNENKEVIRVMGMTQDITERKKNAETIERSLQEKTTLLSEIHHRVKNNLAIVSGLLELQKNELNDERLSEYLDQSIGRIISIAMVHELMYQTHDLSSVNVRSYLEMLLDAIGSTMQAGGNDNVQFEMDIAEYKLNINEAIPIGLMLNELVTNSFKYAFTDQPDKKILVSVKGVGDEVTITYRDNGSGFPEGVDFNTPRNLGLTLVHAQLQQLDATYQAETENGFYLQFTFTIKGIGPHSSFG